MLAQVLGFTLARTIPSKVLFGVLTGVYQVCGGVVRSNSGQIMAHLVNGVSPLSVTQPVNSVLGAINTYQLHRLGRDVTQIGATITQLNQAVGAMSENVAGVNLAVGTVSEGVDSLLAATKHLIVLSAETMFLSGLTLAVSAAGFAFLNKKLKKIDARLQASHRNVTIGT